MWKNLSSSFRMRRGRPSRIINGVPLSDMRNYNLVLYGKQQFSTFVISS